ncbi:MAG: molybdopterin-dependent oxidoreductase [Desulfobacterales bacterium]|nr:molybdopterin-dependent oxidoreductase [Desulfobacterales bacterium]
MKEIRKSYCGLCHPRCGTLLHMENGRITKVTGDPDHPVNRGVICERGRLMPDHVYHPDRLNTPLKRVGEKGMGRWEEVSWDQALDEVALKLSQLRDEYGAETLSFTHGTGRTYHWDARRFYNLFGSPNMSGANNICMCPSYATEYATYGGMAMGEIMSTRCVVIWGTSPHRSEPTGRYPQIVQAKKRGAKVIVIDPRQTKEAQMADHWLQIRPGTDVALMMCWIRLIIEEGLYDREFVENWTLGFDELKTAVSSYTTQRVAGLTNIPADLIETSARLYATTRPGVILWGYGIDKQGVNSTQAARARAILRAVTGNLEVPGGEIFSMAEGMEKVLDTTHLECHGALSEGQKAKQLGADKYPFFGFPGYEKNLAANQRLPKGYVGPPAAWISTMAHIREVMDAARTGSPYPVKAAISLASNPLLALPNTMHVYEALKSLELYVVMEYYMTPSAALADYVFPAASTVEQPEMWLTPDFCMACPQGIDPLYERKNSYYFYRELGKRLGQAEHWPWETVEEVYDHCLGPAGMTFRELSDQYGFFGKRAYRRYEKFGFGTPSGKVEINSSIFKDLGAEPLPVYREPVWSPEGSPDLAEEYPLILITGSRFMPMYHSEQRQIEKARRKMPDPLVSLHPETAAKLGLNQGDWAVISTPQGKIRQRVNLTDIMHPGMVDLHHGWWFPEKGRTLPDLFGAFESNANILCPDGDEFCSPEIGAWPSTALLCKVEKE